MKKALLFLAVAFLLAGCSKEKKANDLADTQIDGHNQNNQEQEVVQDEDQLIVSDDFSNQMNSEEIADDGEGTVDKKSDESKKEKMSEKNDEPSKSKKNEPKDKAKDEDVVSQEAEKCIKDGGVYNTFARKCFKD